MQENYTDGILWATLGENPPNLLALLESWISALDNKCPILTGMDMAIELLSNLLSTRRCLLVVDDVWNAGNLRPFLHGGPQCTHLIVTRNEGVLPVDCVKLYMESMTENESVALLSTGLPSGPDFRLARLAERLGKLPLALRLVNRWFQKIISDGQSFEDAFIEIETSLSGLDVVSTDEQTLHRVIDWSLQRLPPHVRDRYEDLCIFPEDVPIPLIVVENLWATNHAFDRNSVKHLCRRLSDVSLLAFDERDWHIQMSGVIRDYLNAHMHRKLPELNRRFLKVYRPKLPKTWADLADSEKYMWSNLAYHLVAGGLGEELVRLVKDLRYLVTKISTRGVIETELDLVTAQTYAPRDPTLSALYRNLVNASDLLDRCTNAPDISGTLHSRIAHISNLEEVVDRPEVLPGPFLTAAHPLPDLPDPSLNRTLLGHIDKVRGCAISADGSTVVSASLDGTLKVWDSLRGTERTTLVGHAGPVTACALGEKDRLCVSASDDGTLKLWDLAPGRLIDTLRGHDASVMDCAIDENDDYIVSASEDNTLKIWNHPYGKFLTLKGHTAAVKGCALSKDGKVLLSSSLDSTVKVWKMPEGNLMHTLKGHKSGVRGCAISSDGRIAVSASRDGSVIVWDAVGGVETTSFFAHVGGVEACAISEDGKVMVSVGRDNLVKLWHVESGVEIKTLAGHKDWVLDCAISQIGDKIVSASADHTLKIWDAYSENASINTFPGFDEVNDCVVSADGKVVIAVASNGATSSWNVSNGFKPQWDRSYKDALHCCAITPSGKLIISGSGDATIQVSEVESGKTVAVFHGHDGPIRSCAFNRDGRFVISASADKTARLWDIDSGQCTRIFSGHRAGVTACAFHPTEDIIVTGSDDRTLKAWDASNGTELLTINAHEDWIFNCAISPDGKLLVSASNDNTLKVFDFKTGKELQVLRGHSSGVFGCDISPDGKKIASASSDNTLRLWDIRSGNCLATLHVDGRLSSCAWFPDGKQLVAGGQRGVYFLRLVSRDNI
ncbi:MAG TPA: PQQ-binding-like beta-propeller repeat protein [Flavitalea sp.]|nr:PQQ-binding-like beta-propeller repeat protein [Flavitalea sp.]